MLRLPPLLARAEADASEASQDEVRGRRALEAVLSVRDTGAGIAADRPTTMVDGYPRVCGQGGDEAGAQSRLDVGLAPARHFVELHGGSIAIAAGGEGRGTAFTLRLPEQA